MSEDLTNAPELGQQPSAAELDVSSIPDQLPTEDVRGLKSTLEKLKAQVTELKGLQPKAQLIDQITQQGISTDELPARIAALKEQQKSEELLQQREAEIKAQAKAEQEQLQQRYQGEISKLTDQINAQTRRVQLEGVLGRAGGNVADYTDFAAIASRYIEFGDDQAISSFKDVDGSTLYVDDEKQVGKVRAATVDDFIIKAKSGAYGKALQSILPAINQSSGAGLPNSSGGSSGTGPIVLTQAQINNMGSMSNDELQAIKKRGYVIAS